MEWLKKKNGSDEPLKLVRKKNRCKSLKYWRVLNVMNVSGLRVSYSSLDISSGLLNFFNLYNLHECQKFYLCVFTLSMICRQRNCRRNYRHEETKKWRLLGESKWILFKVIESWSGTDLIGKSIKVKLQSEERYVLFICIYSIHWGWVTHLRWSLCRYERRERTDGQNDTHRWTSWQTDEQTDRHKDGQTYRYLQR